VSVSATGCGTDAQGVNECRQIEQTRCEAAKSCGLVSDIPGCQRFYRDQCLHGLPVPPPSSLELQACVATIRAAGQCGAGDQKTLLRDCDPPVTEGARGVLTACGLVQAPEKSVECSFLTPGADAGVGGGGGEGEGGAAGESGSAGDAGG